MKKLVNTTATADIGYVEKLPFRRPSAELEAEVAERVEQIVALLRSDTDADISPLRAELDDLFFDLFDIRTNREEIREFQRTVGRADALAAPTEEVQAAVE